MKPAKGYYCVIQYCPDFTRLEAANIGALLFCPDQHFLKARTVQGNHRIRRFFGSAGHDWSRIESFKAGFEERVSVEQGTISKREDLEKFIATRANLIQVSDPRPMKVTNPDKDLDQLFRELVGGEPPPQLGSLQLVVVGEFSAKQTGSKAVVERILRENEVRLFPASELDRLIEEIRTTAKDVADE